MKKDTLAQVHWLEGKPTSNVAQWLHQCLLHAGQKTMWAVACRWVLPLIFEEVNRARKESLVYPKRDLHQDPQHVALCALRGTIVRGPIPLVRWQIDYIGPLPISEGYQYAMCGHGYWTIGCFSCTSCRSANHQEGPGASLCSLWPAAGD